MSGVWLSARTADESSAVAVQNPFGFSQLSKAGEVKVWDAETGQEMLTLKGHAGGVHERGLQPGRPAYHQRQP